MIELRSEIERLQTVGKMDNFNENKQINQLQVDKKKYEMDMEKCQKELKKTQDQLILIRQEKLEEDKKNLEKKNDFENQKKN